MQVRRHLDHLVARHPHPQRRRHDLDQVGIGRGRPGREQRDVVAAAGQPVAEAGDRRVPCRRSPAGGPLRRGGRSGRSSRQPSAMAAGAGRLGCGASRPAGSGVRIGSGTGSADRARRLDPIGSTSSSTPQSGQLSANRPADIVSSLARMPRTRWTAIRNAHRVELCHDREDCGHARPARRRSRRRCPRSAAASWCWSTVGRSRSATRRDRWRAAPTAWCTTIFATSRCSTSRSATPTRGARLERAHAAVGGHRRDRSSTPPIRRSGRC